MSAFEELDYRRFDTWAIVSCHGLAVIELAQRDVCREWLVHHGYKVDELDLGEGPERTAEKIDRIFSWEENFGYRPEVPPYAALHDGFGQYCLDLNEPTVLEPVGADVAWNHDAKWLRLMLELAMSNCIDQLARGRRFFTLIALSHESPLLGQAFTRELAFGYHDWSRGPTWP